MANFFNSNVDALLRNDLERAYENMVFGSNFSAVFGLFRKEDRDGDAVKVPLSTDFGAGQSATAATAYANATLVGRYAFTVTPFNCYGSTVVPLNQAAFTKGDDNSVVDLLMDESQKCMDSVNMQFDVQLGRTGFGEIGTYTAHSGSTPNYVLTLDYTSTANDITVGATYVSKAAPNSASLRTGSFTVASLQTGAKTMAVTANGGWTPTDNDYIGLSGTMQASASIVQWPGIPGWIPPAASRPVSSSDSFFGVNRSVNETKLAGLYLDGSKLGVLEGINQLAYMIADVPGANPDLCVMSYQTLGKINARLQTERRYVEETVKGPGIDVFYKTVRINGPRGPLDLVGSSSWPSNLVAILDKSSWVLGAPGNKPIVPATPDGNPVQNVPGTDTAVVLYRGQAFVYCDAPGHNGMLTVSTS